MLRLGGGARRNSPGVFRSKERKVGVISYGNRAFFRLVMEYTVHSWARGLGPEDFRKLELPGAQSPQGLDLPGWTDRSDHLFPVDNTRFLAALRSLAAIATARMLAVIGNLGFGPVPEALAI